MYSVFISINAESLRKIVVAQGYPEDHNSNSWKLKDFATWLCYCIKNNNDSQDAVN